MIKKIAILLLVIAFSQYTFAQINFAMFEFNSDADYIDIELQSGNILNLPYKGKFSVIVPYYNTNDKLIKVWAYNHELVNKQLSLEVWPAYIKKDPTTYSFSDGISTIYSTLKVSIFDAHGGSNKLEYNSNYKNYLCSSETLSLNFSNVASLSSPSIPAVLQIQLVKPYTSEWKDLQQFDYSPKPISYDEINSFVEENFHLESIIDDDIHQFALRVNIAGICSNTLNMPPYYLQVSFPKSNITLTDNTLQITNNNQLKVSVKDDFYNKHYDPDNELAPEREFQVNDGRCTIIIDYPQKKSCSVVYYVNVMRLTNNQITTCSDNKADFWYAGQESRDEAIVLHYFDIGPCPTPSFPSSISAKKVNGTSSDNLRVFSQTDEGTQGQKEQPCSSYLYYLNGCTRGKDNP